MVKKTIGWWKSGRFHRAKKIVLYLAEKKNWRSWRIGQNQLDIFFEKLNEKKIEKVEYRDFLRVKRKSSYTVVVEFPYSFYKYLAGSTI